MPENESEGREPKLDPADSEAQAPKEPESTDEDKKRGSESDPPAPEADVAGDRPRLRKVRRHRPTLEEVRARQAASALSMVGGNGKAKAQVASRALKQLGVEIDPDEILRLRDENPSVWTLAQFKARQREAKAAKAAKARADKLRKRTDTPPPGEGENTEAPEERSGTDG